VNYLTYHSVDVVNGPGTRCTLFVAGCEHQCRGCYNQSSWRADAGHLFDQKMADQIINDLNDTRIRRRGVSLSGGDPLYDHNLSDIEALILRVRREAPGKDIWMWSGYTLQELDDRRRQIVNLVDVFIDGRFEPSLADPSLLWRGSSNQVVHQMEIDKGARP
jgi:anaerobic ribonucleoside-triphosphate reductase activating protein